MLWISVRIFLFAFLPHSKAAGESEKNKERIKHRSCDCVGVVIPHPTQCTHTQCQGVAYMNVAHGIERCSPALDVRQIDSTQVAGEHRAYAIQNVDGGAYLLLL